MADSIRRVSYYYTTISDKPGEGARLLETFRSAGVNLLAFHAFPSARKAQVDFVPSDSALFTAAAKGAKIKLSKPKTAFLIDGDDRVGALAGILARLGAAKINVTAVTGVCAGMGRYGALLWVKQGAVNKAASTLGAMQLAGASPPECVWAELLAHLVDHAGDDAVTLGLERVAGGFEQRQLALTARSDELREGDPEQARGDAPGGAEPRQQLAGHGVHCPVRLDGVGERSARLPGREIRVAQLHRDGAGDQAGLSDVGAGPVGQGEQLGSERSVVVQIGGERLVAAHRLGLTIGLDRRSIDAARPLVQPSALAFPQPAHQRLPIMWDHIAHGAEAKARQPLLRLEPDERDVHEGELEHEVGLRRRGHDVHAVRRRAPGRRRTACTSRPRVRRPTSCSSSPSRTSRSSGPRRRSGWRALASAPCAMWSHMIGRRWWAGWGNARALGCTSARAASIERRSRPIARPSR